MPTEFTMPKLGLTMEDGTILEWLVPDGAEVEDGDAVLLIQTDKVETEVDVVGRGRLRQVAAVGDTLACGEVIGLLLAPGEDDRAPAQAAPTAPVPPVRASTTGVPAPTVTAASVDDGGGRRPVSPNARRVARELGVDLASVRGTGPGGRVVSEDVEETAAARAAQPPPEQRAPAAAAGPAAAAVRAGDPVPATFAARSLADLLGIDLRAVPADPRDGRVTRDGVASHVRERLAGASSPPPATTQTPTRVVPLRGMRGTIARRMHRSLQEMAQLTLTMDADVDAVVADRRWRKDAGEPVPGFTDYVVAAVAAALCDHPHVNAQITPDGIAELPGIHVGVAVALPGGLVVPVVRDADRRSLDEIAAETARLATAARDGALTLDDVEGGTFSVSALGMYGVDAFTPVINPPNVAILGVGRVRQEVVLAASGPIAMHRVTLSLTWDHRAFDGAPAAEFTRSVVGSLAAAE